MAKAIEVNDGLLLPRYPKALYGLVVAMIGSCLDRLAALTLDHALLGIPIHLDLCSDLSRLIWFGTISCPFLESSPPTSPIRQSQKQLGKQRGYILSGFGVLYSLLWPSLIQHLLTRLDGLPKLWIIGIDFPEPGFRLAQRIEETER